MPDLAGREEVELIMMLEIEVSSLLSMHVANVWVGRWARAAGKCFDFGW